MLTVFIIRKDGREELERTISSLEGQEEEFRKHIYLKILSRPEDRQLPQEKLQKWREAFAGLTVEDGGNELLRNAWRQMRNVETELATVILAGETYLGNGLEKGCRFLLEERRTDAALLTNVSRRIGAGKGEIPVRLYSLEKAGDILKLPGCVSGMVFRAAAAGGPEPGDGPCSFEAAMCRILLANKMAAVVEKGCFAGRSPLSDVDEMRTEWEQGDWYLGMVEDYCLPLLAQREKGKTPLLAQAQALFALKVAFHVNMEHRDKGTMRGKQLQRYLEGCSRCLGQISGRLISISETTHSERRFIYDQWSALHCLKYESLAEKLEIREDGSELYCSCLENGGREGFLPSVRIDLMETEKGIWRLDCSLERFLTESSLELEVCLNGKPAPLRFMPRFSQVSFFGWPVVRKMAFAVEAPVSALERKNRLEFWLKDCQGRRMALSIAARDYQSKVTSLLKHSYWCFDRYMVTVEWKEKRSTAILANRAGRMARMGRELRLLKEIGRAPYGSRQMFLMRCLYWLAYPVLSRKKIWMTFDKLYKGGDCGEYFYKYMSGRGSGRNRDGITPAYVINAGSPDRRRLEREGFRPMIYRSWRQRLMYLYADAVFATHSGVHAFCGFSKWEISFLQDRLHCANFCIQHGLSVQDLTFDSNRVVNNNKRYYCASRYEVQNLSRPAYDYDPEVLRLTGIPRYDGLVNREGKQILITPTWRAYIAMPSAMGSARPYNPDFKQTDYYRIFQRLLENRKLAETAARRGYRIVYLLHPVISSQKEDFHPGEGIEIVTAMDVSYEQILTESSLMVTDYSGVQFDFAYMRKPVVYFHPPELPPHYEEGGFSYETQAFGEICTEPEELAEVLCEYMETGCRLKDLYRARQEDFFAFDDQESCRRIYEDALDYFRQRGQEDGDVSYQTIH